MRVLQLIDSLEAGGAERMAVNYANVLSEEIAFSALVVTRKEGVLKKQLEDKVNYYFLNKKRTWDVTAVLKLRKYIISHQVQLIQAHSSSFFLAVLVKLTVPKLKIIWHDHYGNSDFLENRPKFALQMASFFFNGVISVNEKLKAWALQQLYCKKVIYLANFTTVEKRVGTSIKLQGKEGKRILCLANLRRQKNHFLLIEVASKIKETHPEWSFHLVGKDFQDNYATDLKKLIKKQQLEQQLFLYDSCANVSGVLAQAEIGVLTSDSEGLPLAVLEYGLHKKAVVLTDVGQLSTVIENEVSGFIVPPNEADLFYNRLLILIENKSLRQNLAEKLHQKVTAQFSEKAVVKEYIHWVRTIE